jgi:hypothetical protein
MKNAIDARLAGMILIVLMILLLVMHVLILAGFLPYDIVWGGQIDDPSSVVGYEAAALIIMFVFLAIVALRLGYIKADRLKRVAGIGMWIVFAYFVFNSVANFASAVSMENLIFGPISIAMALLSLRVAVSR